MDMTSDYLQNEVILILHHVEDCLKGLSEGAHDYARRGIEDIKEVAERIKSKLPEAQQEGFSELEEASLASWVNRNCRFAKKKTYLTSDELAEVRSRFGDTECSFAKDDDGYYCYTHRARSKSYATIDEIPQSRVDFISSTS